MIWFVLFVLMHLFILLVGRIVEDEEIVRDSPETSFPAPGGSVGARSRVSGMGFGGDPPPPVSIGGNPEFTGSGRGTPLRFTSDVSGLAP